MKITIDVKRAEQSFDLTTMRQQNYLVVEFAGQEIKVPCDEAQLAAAIKECIGHTVPPEERERLHQHVRHPVQIDVGSIATERAAAAPAVTSREFHFEPKEPEEQDPVSEDEPLEAEPPMFVAPELKPVPVPPRTVQPLAAGLRPVARKPRQADDAGISQG